MKRSNIVIFVVFVFLQLQLIEKIHAAVDEAPTEIKSFQNYSVTDGINSFVWSAVFTFSDYSYREPRLMEISGPMMGFTIGSTYNMANAGHYYSADITFMQGDLQYNGMIYTLGDANSFRSYSQGTSDNYFDLRVLRGINVQQGRRNYSFFDFNAGLGFWRLKNEFDGNQLERTQTYTYLPLVAGWTRHFSGAWHIRPSIEMDLFLGGSNTTVTGNRSNNYSQGSGSGQKIALEFKREIESGQTLSIETYYRRWGIGDSDFENIEVDGVTYRFYEPANETRIFGLSTGLVF